MKWNGQGKDDSFVALVVCWGDPGWDCWKRGEVALLSPEGSHKRSFRILGGQGSWRAREALGPSNPGAPSPSPPAPQPQKELYSNSHTRAVQRAAATQE